MNILVACEESQESLFGTVRKYPDERKIRWEKRFGGVEVREL